MSFISFRNTQAQIGAKNDLNSVKITQRVEKETKVCWTDLQEFCHVFETDGKNGVESNVHEM